jgi:hypothetical protein
MYTKSDHPQKKIDTKKEGIAAPFLTNKTYVNQSKHLLHLFTHLTTHLCPVIRFCHHINLLLPLSHLTCICRCLNTHCAVRKIINQPTILYSQPGLTNQTDNILFHSLFTKVQKNITYPECYGSTAICVAPPPNGTAPLPRGWGSPFGSPVRTFWRFAAALRSPAAAALWLPCPALRLPCLRLPCIPPVAALQPCHLPCMVSSKTQDNRLKAP